MKYEKIEYTEGMTVLFANENQELGALSELNNYNIGDFAARLDMDFGKAIFHGVCLFGNPDICFQVSNKGDSHNKLTHRAMFLINLLKTGLHTLDTAEKKSLVMKLIKNYEETGISHHGDELLPSPAEQINGTFFVTKRVKNKIISETPIKGYDAAYRTAKEMMLNELALFIDDDNVNISREINLNKFVGYRLNSTVITVEKVARLN